MSETAEALQSDLISRAGFRHAFFTRRGGVSRGPYASLNFSSTVGDEAACVSENLRRGAVALGVGEAALLFGSQVHGADAHFLSAEVQDRDRTITLEGDAIGGSNQAAAYGIRTADCIPLLLADPKSGAVMAVHAGWRGVVRGVIEAGVKELCRGSGARAADLLAAIGPHISQAAFEVSEDVASELERASPEPGVVDRSRAKPHVDLRRIARAQLHRSGLALPHIDDVFGCTLLDSERFFSFRRDGKASGRHLSAIVPRR